MSAWLIRSPRSSKWLRRTDRVVPTRCSLDSTGGDLVPLGFACSCVGARCVVRNSIRQNNSIMGSHLGLVYHPEIIACSILDMTAREVLKYTANPKGRLHQDLPDPAAPWYTRMIPEKRFPSAVKFTDPIAVDDVVLSVDMITGRPA